MCGIAVATMAMVCTLSIFNGFQGLVSTMYCSFDPPLKITPDKGKVFDAQSGALLKVKAMPEIALFTEVLEDNVLLRYKGRQVPATLKGVSDNFGELTGINQVLIDGEFKLHDEINNFGTLGVGLASNLGMNAGFAYPLEIYALKRNVRIHITNAASAYVTDYAYITGVFCTNQPVYDNNYLIVPIVMARTLFDYPREVSAIELKLKEGADTNKVQEKIKKILGSEFQVKNQYQQQETAYKMMSMEKWISYLILCFILVIAAFNVIGSLSILIVEKQQDVIILRNIGASNKLISRIFLFEGWLISSMGGILGIILGLGLCFLQQKLGLLKFSGASGSFVVDAYPLIVEFKDILFTFMTVLVIGFLSVLYPVRYLSRRLL